MGKVWRAHHTALKRDDALKVLPDAFASDPERLRRFQREAQVLASLNNPNIAHVYGLEQSGGVQALVMELIDRGLSSRRLARGLRLAKLARVRRPDRHGRGSCCRGWSLRPRWHRSYLSCHSGDQPSRLRPRDSSAISGQMRRS